MENVYTIIFELQFYVKDTYLSAEGFYNETIAEVTTEEIPAKVNSEIYNSFNKRKKLMLDGKKVFFNTRIAVDLFYLQMWISR